MSAIEQLEAWVKESIDRRISIENDDGRGVSVIMTSGDSAKRYDSHDYSFCSLEELILIAMGDK